MFKFSVIIPIYNAEKYLKDAIDSVVNQTVGINNIQIILVNDGSKDNSEEICKIYQNQYPNNIVYIRQDNHGVSIARNHGLGCATGKYINFLDADDMWSLDAFEKAEKMLEEDKDIDVVAFMMEFFEAKKGLSHPLNWKFTKDQIININDEPEKIQMHIASCFIRSSVLRDIKFNEKLKYAEDALLVNRILLKKMRYGIIKSSHYMYRKHNDGQSAIDKCNTDYRYYNETLDNFHAALIDESYNRFGNVCSYIQYVIMYDLQWRIKKEIPENIEEDSEYRRKIEQMLDYIDDDVIMKQRNIWIEHKLLALDMKYNEPIVSNLIVKSDGFYFNDTLIQPFNCENILNIIKIDINDNVLKVRGIINTPIANESSFYVLDDSGKHYYMNLQDFEGNEKKCIYGHFYYTQIFDVNIPINGVMHLSFMMKYHQYNAVPIRVNVSDVCRMPKSKYGYLKINGHIIEKTKMSLIVRNKSTKKHLKHELRFCIHIFKDKPVLCFYRMMAYLFHFLFNLNQSFKNKKSDICIISDRPSMAGDNGEALFKYMQQAGYKRTYFAISKKSKDYKKMKMVGKVLNTESLWYKIMFLCSDYIISSQANDETINPFGKYKKYIKDLYRFKFIFLQHGIIKDDLSSWLNASKKDIWMFITSSSKEYKSVSSNKYGYEKGTVVLTGLPRFDFLENNAVKNKIAIIPTWRYGISGCFKDNNPVYNESFKDTKFYQFYNNLMNNERLIKCMEKYHCTGVFCLHPMFKPQLEHFTSNDFFQIVEPNYHNLFENYDMVITDYSSVFFDFAYLGKPVVYAQFDKEEFFKNHSYNKGYFDYDEDGFGTVTKTVDETVDEVIKLIQNKFTTEKVYEQRINKFFQYHDKSNCNRVLESKQYKENCKKSSF